MVLEAGLNTSGDTFAALADALAATTRVCWSDRAGVGGSPALAADAPDPWPGSSADALAAELEAAARRRRTSCSAGRTAAWSRRRSPPGTPTSPRGWCSRTRRCRSSSPTRRGTTSPGSTAAARSTRTPPSRSSRTVDLGDLPVVVLTAEDLTGKLRRAVGGVPRTADRLLRRRGPRACRGGRPRDPRVDAGPGGGGRRRRRRGGPRRGAAGAVRRAVRRPRRPLPLVGRRVPSNEHEGRAHLPPASPRDDLLAGAPAGAVPVREATVAAAPAVPSTDGRPREARSRSRRWVSPGCASSRTPARRTTGRAPPSRTAGPPPRRTGAAAWSAPAASATTWSPGTARRRPRPSAPCRRCASAPASSSSPTATGWSTRSWGHGVRRSGPSARCASSRPPYPAVPGWRRPAR